jgi:signal transduction histidine kinase
MSQLTSQEITGIFDKLPTAYAVIQPDAPAFSILKANDAYQALLTPDAAGNIAGKSFSKIASQHIVEDNDLNNVNVQATLERVLQQQKNKTEIVQLKRQKQEDTRYCRFEHTPILNGDGSVKYIVQSIEDVTEKLTSKEKNTADIREVSSRRQLHSRNSALEDQIAKKIAQYKAASKELDNFIYSVSHDLRAPLRRIDGFSQELMNEYMDQLDEMGAHYLKRVRQGARDMGNLIDALLKLSRISRREVEIEKIDFTDLVATVFDKLIEMEPERDVDIEIEENLVVHADHGLAKAMLTNLLSNALKFTSKKDRAEIEVGTKTIDNSIYYFVKDNGAGFDPEYADKLFKAFDRLHSQKEFKGSGIGLATVKRIVNLHGGTIWGESKPGEGATFYFNFQKKQ